MIPEIHIEDFNYPLPDERIAKYPLADRDASKLLVYKGSPVESRFAEISDLLPEGSITVFNDTKVVPAWHYVCSYRAMQMEVYSR